MKLGLRHILLLLLLLSFAMLAQVSAQVANLRILSINSDEFPTVRVVFDARNRNGVPIENLTPEQLTIQEDEQAREVTEVTSYVNAERPISLALVIDVSPSASGQPLENAKLAANNLLDQLNEQDRVALISVRAEVPVDINQLDPNSEVNFTIDRNAIRNVVDFLELAPDDTALYDAMFKAALLTANENVANRAIILMSDGIDTVSVSTPDDPINEANRTGIPIFTIGLGEPRDQGYLQRLAARTGGTFKETNNPEELTSLFANVLELLKKEYTLTYQSALEQGASGEHRLTISTRLDGKLVEEGGSFTLPGGEAAAAVDSSPTPAEDEGGESAGDTPTDESPEATKEANEVPNAEVVEPDQEQSWSVWVKGNLMLVIGIAVVFLLLIVALIAFLVMRRNNEEEQEQDNWSAASSTAQSLPPYPTQVGPPTQEQNLDPMWAAQSPMKDAYHYPPNLQGSAPSGNYPQPQFVDPISPKGSTVPADPINSIPPTQVVPPVKRDPAEGKKTVIFTRPDAQKKPIPYLLRKDDNQRFELVGNRIFIGRSPDNGILLNDETVSGKHAVIVKQKDDILLQDTGSTNFTFINEEEVKGRQLLKKGDLIRFGKVEMTFHTGEDGDK